MNIHIVGSFLFAGWVTASSAAAAVETEIFEASRPGQAPSGWQTSISGEGTPRWCVEKEASAPSAPWVLKQSAWTPNPSFPLCIKQGTRLQDGFVEVKFKPLLGTNDQAGGLVWRYRDSANYYVVRANALEQNVVLYKMERGKRTALDIVGRVGGYGTKAKVPAREWSLLRVEFAGPRFRVFLNGKAMFEVSDHTFIDAGAVGLWTKADSVTVFDDFCYGAKVE